MIASQGRMTLKTRASSKSYRWVFSFLRSTPGYGGIRKADEVLTEQHERGTGRSRGSVSDGSQPGSLRLRFGAAAVSR
jgi:hypothetical protein